jgi:hypothetical protein
MLCPCDAASRICFHLPFLGFFFLQYIHSSKYKFLMSQQVPGTEQLVDNWTSTISFSIGFFPEAQ